MVSTDFYKQVVERFETRRLRHDFSNDLRNKVFCTPAAALHAMLFVRRHMALGSCDRSNVSPSFPLSRLASTAAIDAAIAEAFPDVNATSLEYDGQLTATARLLTCCQRALHGAINSRVL